MAWNIRRFNRKARKVEVLTLINKFNFGDTWYSGNENSKKKSNEGEGIFWPAMEQHIEFHRMRSQRGKLHLDSLESTNLVGNS